VISTRGRSYRKNDQAYVEQKNWQTVRRLVGYDRLESKEALSLLQQLYSCIRLQVNFFRPVRKLVAKERLGAKTAGLVFQLGRQVPLLLFATGTRFEHGHI